MMCNVCTLASTTCFVILASMAKKNFFVALLLFVPDRKHCAQPGVSDDLGDSLEAS